MYLWIIDCASLKVQVKCISNNQHAKNDIITETEDSSDNLFLFFINGEGMWTQKSLSATMNLLRGLLKRKNANLHLDKPNVIELLFLPFSLSLIWPHHYHSLRTHNAVKKNFTTVLLHLRRQWSYSAKRVTWHIFSIKWITMRHLPCLIGLFLQLVDKFGVLSFSLTSHSLNKCLSSGFLNRTPQTW